MPATTPGQQRLMAQAYVLKKGKIQAADIDPDYREQIRKLADDMTTQQLKDFASTKHSDMPKKHVKEYAFYWWDTQADMAAHLYNGIDRDSRDSLVQNFMDFVSGKEKKEVAENFAAPAAAVGNTPGIGNVVPATPGTIGSGDVPGARAKKKKRKKISVYEDWLRK